MSALLPLFPLNVVLFPGGELPLHIFEDRYKEMVGEAVAESTEFGIVLAAGKGIVNCGCTARVEKVTKKYPDGRFDVIARGVRRFEILTLDEEKDYLRGLVEYFDDRDDAPPTAPDALAEAVAGHRALTAANDLPAAELPEDHPRLSFLLAEPVTDVEFRQVLLSTRSEAERIRRLAAFFPSFVEKSREIAHARDIAGQNGKARKI